MRHILLGILAVAAVSMKFVAAQPSGGGPVVERLDPALDEILSVDATLDVIRQDYFGAGEGPTWVPETGGGYLVFSDMAANKIYKWDPVARQLSVLFAGTGYTSNDVLRVRALDNGRLIVALLGTNGLALDLDGRLVFCAHGDRLLGRIEADGTRTILAARFEGKRFNGPNDLVVKSDGSIYFTDLGAPLVGGFANSPDRELDFQGVFRWTPDGAVQLISRNTSNGIAFSPDEAHLYVTGGGGVTRFDVMPDGSVTNGQVHVQRGADGLRVDAHGYLYGAGGRSGVWIASPDGDVLGVIRTPDMANALITNIAFGDADGKGLYIVTLRSVFHIRLERSAW